MEYDAPKIFAAFEREAREVLQKNARQWLNANRIHVQRLQGILNTIKIDLVHNQEWPSNPDKLWSGLRDNLLKIRHWITAVKA